MGVHVITQNTQKQKEGVKAENEGRERKNGPMDHLQKILRVRLNITCSMIFNVFK